MKHILPKIREGFHNSLSRLGLVLRRNSAVALAICIPVSIISLVFSGISLLLFSEIFRFFLALFLLSSGLGFLFFVLSAVELFSKVKNLKNQFQGRILVHGLPIQAFTNSRDPRDESVSEYSSTEDVARMIAQREDMSLDEAYEQIERLQVLSDDELELLLDEANEEETANIAAQILSERKKFIVH